MRLVQIEPPVVERHTAEREHRSHGEAREQLLRQNCLQGGHYSFHGGSVTYGNTAL